MPSDPRLANVQLLTLAAFRVRRRRQEAVPDWRTSVGISSLLEAARHLPRRDPWDVESLDATSGLGKLLAEARQWEKEHDDGA
jgi:hypothetical protein